MTTPSRGDRHTARLARLRPARRIAVAGVVLGLASGLSLLLFAAERPIRVLGAVIVVIAVVQVLTLPALFRVQLPDPQRQQRR
jgi:membrane protein YdbS with pleckstrin-like domain